jgi:general L-amino acid transport system substrate-binding protein
LAELEDGLLRWIKSRQGPSLAAVKAGGNYGEIFGRNVGKSSPLKLDRGLDAAWGKGGLMYAIPFK